MKANTLTFVSGLLLAGATSAAVHWYDRAKSLRDAVEYMVDQEDDVDEVLRMWTQEGEK